MGLDFAQLTTETRSRQEANILGQSGPHKPGGQDPPGSMNTRMRDFMKSKEQLMLENHRNQRMGRSGGHITENRGLLEVKEANGESRTGDHGLNGGTCGLEGRQGGEIETLGGEILVDGGEAGLRLSN